MGRFKIFVSLTIWLNLFLLWFFFVKVFIIIIIIWVIIWWKWNNNKWWRIPVTSGFDFYDTFSVFPNPILYPPSLPPFIPYDNFYAILIMSTTQNLTRFYQSPPFILINTLWPIPHPTRTLFFYLLYLFLRNYHFTPFISILKHIKSKL